MKVLVVDDHEIARDGLRLQLLQISRSCEVFEAGTCAQAIAACRDGRFDLVLLDLTLPDSTGLETLRRFRESAPQSPVVVLSAVTGREVVMAAIEEGAMGFIPKASSRTEIVTALEMILAGASMCHRTALLVEQLPGGAKCRRERGLATTHRKAARGAPGRHSRQAQQGDRG